MHQPGDRVDELAVARAPAERRLRRSIEPDLVLSVRSDEARAGRRQHRGKQQEDPPAAAHTRLDTDVRSVSTASVIPWGWSAKLPSRSVDPRGQERDDDNSHRHGLPFRSSSKYGIRSAFSRDLPFATP